MHDPKFAVTYIVSIHTRHYWRVKPSTLSTVCHPDLVSIHTRHYWRVKRGGCRQARQPESFQSTPAITGG